MKLSQVNESINEEIRTARMRDRKPSKRPAGTTDNPHRGQLVGEDQNVDFEAYQVMQAFQGGLGNYGDSEDEVDAYDSMLEKITDLVGQERDGDIINWDQMSVALDKLLGELDRSFSVFDGTGLHAQDALDVIAFALEDYGHGLEMWSDDVRNFARIEEKKKGKDGKACWKGYRYHETPDGEETCIQAKGVN